MNTKKLFTPLSSLLAAASLLAACGGQPAATSAPAAPSGATSTPAAQTGAKPYIPIISKGFQHQFWQSVKAGAEKAAGDLNVNITFEGPENESQVDKQIEM